MGVTKEYTVTVKEKVTVAAALPVQEHRLPLSNLDLLLPAIEIGVFFCYEKPMRSKQTSPNFLAIVDSLKAALAQVLVAYYPLAGEVVPNSAGEPELLCNNRGVDFLVAYADAELAELKLHNPDESVEKKLVPKKRKEGVVCFQATELKCGGLVMACTFDHRISDAFSANMFLVALSESAAGKPLSHLPSFRRSLLGPRHPLSYDSSLDHLYVPVSLIPPPPPPPETSKPDIDEAINRIYYITAEDIQRLQSSTNHRTKIECFTAYLWIAAARAAGPEGKSCPMGIVVDGRSRLGDPAAMGNYFGNVLSIPYGALDAEDLGRMELGEVAEVVHGWLAPGATGEHFRGLVDWVEAHRPEPAMARIYCSEAAGCVVSSGRGFPVGKIDFGWGKAALASYHFPWGGSSGYVMPMPSAKGNGDWLVYAHVRRAIVEVLEAADPPVFRRLMPEYYISRGLTM